MASKVISDFSLLQKNRINCAPFKLAKTEDATALAAKKLGFPVVLKIVSPDIPHKTDRGAVLLNLQNEQEVRAGYKKVLQNAKGARIQGVLVQKMAAAGIEVIIGGKRDAQFGQLIMFGMGGIFVEVYKDVSWRVCPIDKSEAARMIREVKGYKVLAGVRGKPINEAALIDVLAKVSQLLIKKNPAELDLNPVIVHKDYCEVVDMRMVK
ncbi:Acetate--CoA ligase [ADP-forming] I subunit beta [Candidatus Anstonella stagnisolia]|nr:Acetate--CoA ligase [ADP-forming] I subunit beta [Candidatus Anstonella stagnisolia]